MSQDSESDMDIPVEGRNANGTERKSVQSEITFPIQSLAWR